MNEQFCQICTASVEPNVRYREYICFECCAKAVDEDGRKLGFGNESLSGGFVARYVDTNETRNSHICYIDGIECYADEAHMGGIVIRLYDENLRRSYPNRKDRRL